MKKIFVHGGQVTFVSDEDYLFLVGYNWYKDSHNYVIAWIDNRDQSMHRIVARKMGLDLTKGEVDHVDGNILNNCRENLRIATHSQNIANSRISKNNTSGYKGVSQCKRTGRWRAKIEVNYQQIHLGTFDTKKGAHQAYCEAAKHYFGEFARAK